MRLLTDKGIIEAITEGTGIKEWAEKIFQRVPLELQLVADVEHKETLKAVGEWLEKGPWRTGGIIGIKGVTPFDLDCLKRGEMPNMDSIQDDDGVWSGEMPEEVK